MIRKTLLSKVLSGISGIVLIALSCCSKGPDKEKNTDGEQWRRQALECLIPFWQSHVRDTVSGAYFLNLSREGVPAPPWDKYPPMISRQVFGFTSAYLLSGDERYLSTAREGAEYLVKHAWDTVYGGWFDMLDANGNPSVTVKTVPNQLYTNVGLSLYYFATGDEEVLKLVRKSVAIQREKGFDNEYGGYYQALTRELGVADSSKSKHSHYGYTSSLLINLYTITGDKDILGYADELMRISFSHLRDPDEGWFGGFPVPLGRKWEPVAAGSVGKSTISAGAQLTATLALLRMFELTGDSTYCRYGLALSSAVTKAAYDTARGCWFDNFYSEQPHQVSDTGTVTWWLQSYGMLAKLHEYRLTGAPAALGTYNRMAEFWNRYFVDHQYGGVYLSVTPGGKPVVSSKALAWKASYHEMENALLNYLYLNLYVNNKPAELFFHIINPVEGRKHLVSLAEDREVRILGVTVNGKKWDSYDPAGRSVTLPAGDLRIKVVLGYNPE